MSEPTLRRRLTHAARELRQRQTTAEQALWERLRGKRCGGLKFRRQYVIEHFIVDFCCHAHRLVIELNGSVHDRPEVAERDTARAERLRLLGYEVLVFSNDEVFSNIDGVVQRILDHTNQQPLSRR